MWPFDAKATGLATTHRVPEPTSCGRVPHGHMCMSWAAPIDNGAAEAHYDYDYLNVSFGAATSSQLLSFCSGATEACTNSFRAAHLIHSERYYALRGS